jgi:hypothetical protein
MARWINNRASILGLSWGGERKTEPRTVNPGQVFDADEADIPAVYRTLHWVTSAEGYDLTDSGERGTPDVALDHGKGTPDLPAVLPSRRPASAAPHEESETRKRRTHTENT